MAFLTATTITSSCLASAAPQADSWWLGHVEPDDVVIADIVGQALDSFPHGPESAHKNGIIHSHIHSHPPMRAPKVNRAFTCPLPVQCGGGRRPGRRLGTRSSGLLHDGGLPA